MSNHDTLQPNTNLHLLFNRNSDCLRDCLAQLGTGDSLILVNTGVLLLLDTAWMRGLPAGCMVYALEAEVQAHGLAELQPKSGSVLIDDVAWAKLVMSHRHCLSWK